MSHGALFPHLWRLVCEADARRLQAWRAMTTPGTIRSRQVAVRDAIQRMIGPFPDRCPLSAEVTGGFERDGYTVELVRFASRPGFHVTAAVYTPTGLAGPYPGIISPCGHSANGLRAEPYQLAHIGLVRQGFQVLTYDPVSQGERVQYLDDAGKPTLVGCCHEHCMAGNQMNLTGHGFANVRIWDGIRALDYLLERGQADPARLGVTGNSGGGTLSTFLLCLDERYAAAAPSCYITTLVHRIATRMAADSEQQFVPMLAEGVDHPELLLPFAPKPLLVCAAIQDFFPIEGARQTVADLKEVYGVLGHPGHVSLCEANERHGFTKTLREGMTRWFNLHLRGDDAPYEEAPATIEDDASLFATPTGQVLTSLPGEVTIHQLVQRDAPPAMACVGQPAAVVAALPRLLGIEPAAAKRPWPRPFAAANRAVPPPLPPGVVGEAVNLRSDFDVDLSGWLLRPARPTGEPVLLLPDDAGCAPLLARGQAAWTLAAAGRTVLTIDPRGVGQDVGELPDGVPGRRQFDFYGLEVDLTYTSWMLGRPLLGQRVFDALCAAQWLRQRCGRTVAVHGLGEGGLLALLCGALDSEVTAVEVVGALLSWRNLFETEVYAFLPNILVPDILSYGDLPEIAASLAPRPLTIAAAVDATRRPVAATALATTYEVCRAAYQAAGAAEALALR